MRKLEAAQFRIFNGLLQFLVLKLGHFTTLSTYLVMMRLAIENTKLSKFQLSHYSLYIYGICSKCDRANKRKRVNNNNKKEK